MSGVTATRAGGESATRRAIRVALRPGRIVRRRRPRLTGAAKGYLFVAPALAYLALTALYPLASVVVMSFQDVAEGRWRFAGTGQYLRALGDGLM